MFFKCTRPILLLLAFAGVFGCSRGTDKPDIKATPDTKITATADTSSTTKKTTPKDSTKKDDPIVIPPDEAPKLDDPDAKKAPVPKKADDPIIIPPDEAPKLDDPDAKKVPMPKKVDDPKAEKLEEEKPAPFVVPEGFAKIIVDKKLDAEDAKTKFPITIDKNGGFIRTDPTITKIEIGKDYIKIYPSGQTREFQPGRLKGFYDEIPKSDKRQVAIALIEGTEYISPEKDKNMNVEGAYEYGINQFTKGPIKLTGEKSSIRHMPTVASAIELTNPGKATLPKVDGVKMVPVVKTVPVQVIVRYNYNPRAIPPLQPVFRQVGTQKVVVMEPKVDPKGYKVTPGSYVAPEYKLTIKPLVAGADAADPASDRKFIKNAKIEKDGDDKKLTMGSGLIILVGPDADGAKLNMPYAGAAVALGRTSTGPVPTSKISDSIGAISKALDELGDSPLLNISNDGKTPASQYPAEVTKGLDKAFREYPSYLINTKSIGRSR